MLFCVKASVSHSSKNSLCKSFLCATAFVCKGLPSDSKNFLTCRRAKMSWEKLWWDEKGLAVLRWNENSWEKLRWHMRRDAVRYGEKSWDELRRAQIGWNEMKCGVWSASAKCKVWRVQCEVWSFKCDLWSNALLSHKARTHGPGWRTAHASSIDEKGIRV